MKSFRTFSVSCIYIVGMLATSSVSLASPVGPTAVEELMSRLGGTLPFPPEKIVTTLKRQGVDIFGATILPHGRSLERNLTDYEKPRTIVSLYFGKRQGKAITEPSRFVFIAYTPSARELEIIGGTEAIPNDFFIVPDYEEGNLNAKPVKPNQGTSACLACHQNGGPIFPAAPWSETNQDLQVAAHMRRLQNLDPFAKWILDNYTFRVSDFDDSVRFAAREKCASSINCVRDKLRPSSTLAPRQIYPGPDRYIEQGPDNDPLITRMNWWNALDSFEYQSPDWTISRTRNGNVSFPNKSPTQLFGNYCGRCHRGGSPVIPLLPLDNLAALKTYKGAIGGRTVKELLKSKIMPPIMSSMPSPEDRLRMIQALDIEN